MHALVTGIAATLPLVLIALMVAGIVSKQERTRVINWLAAIPAFGITVVVANVYASQHGGSGMWWWYGVLAFLTIFVVLPCASSGDDSSSTPSNT